MGNYVFGLLGFALFAYLIVQGVTGKPIGRDNRGGGGNSKEKGGEE